MTKTDMSDCDTPMRSASNIVGSTSTSAWRAANHDCKAEMSNSETRSSGKTKMANKSAD